MADLKRIKQNLDIKVAVAGGINLNTIEDYIAANADIIVVGNALVKDSNRKNVAQKMKDKIRAVH